MEQLESKDHLSIHQLTLPFMNHDDANRLQMTSSHLTQALPLIDSEPARAQSIYNKYMVEYSNMIIRAKDNMENLGTINLMDEEFLLLKSDKELELYKIDTPILSAAFTARNTFITNKKKIKKNEPILINGNATEEGNLKIGVNGLTGYMVYGNNFEDSIIISESFAKKLVHVEKDVVKFVVNANEYLLNIYGDKDNYKCLPDIGDYINPNSRIICAKRVIDKGYNAFIELSKHSNDKINFFGNDTIYHSKGKVIDISIYSNVDDEESLHGDFYNSVKPYLDRNKENINNFVNIVEQYLKDYKDKENEFTFGPNLQYYYNKFRKIDKDNVLTLGDKKFNGLYFKITIERECVAEVGSKLSNTHGGKGIITEILPDNEMPIRESDNKPLDIILSPNGVIGRLNIGQIFETTLNRIAEEVYKDLLNQKSNEDFINLYIEFMKDLLPNRLHDQLKQIEKLKDKKLETFINSIKDNGYLLLPQVPFENILFENMKKWYNKYNMNNDYVTIKGKRVKNPILTGSQYILKLKHEPQKKISSTSIRKVGTKSLQPSKAANEYKNYKIATPSTPNTLGEQETAILTALSDNMHVLKELIFLKSADVKNREKFLDKLYDNEEIKLSEFDNLESISVKNLNYYLNVLGLTLNS